MKKWRKCWLALLATTAVSMTACGGGGGGGGGDAPAPNLADAAYTGIRTEAYIEAVNAEALVLEAYGGLDYQGAIPLAAANSAAVITATASDPFMLATFFKQVAAFVEKDAQIKTLALLDPAQECLNYPAGTLSDTLVETVSSTTGTVSGAIYYSNCDIGGMIVDGTLNLTLTINLETGALTLAMTMNPLGYDDGIMPFALTGRISGTVATNVYGLLVSRLTLNVTLDDLSGKTFWLNNYEIDETEETTGLRSTMSGRFYENDYGFVDFVTDPLDTIFVPFNPSDPTYDGRIDYTGSAGSHATLWLGVNQNDYCINVFNTSGVVDIGTCVQ